MKKRKFLTTFIAGTLALSMSISATAATWDNVDDYEKLSNAFQDTEAEVHIILSGNITNEHAETLTANIGQTYTIDGKEYTLTDVHFGGAGDVIINADINGSENDDALNTYDSVNVTVNGDVSGHEDGIDANDQSIVKVNGNVSSKDEDGIDANDQANVTVNGNVYGGHGADGIDASDDAVVTVKGDVHGGDGLAPDKDGNLFEGTMSDPDGFSDGGSGIEAGKNSQVKVDGNVYGGDSYGTYSFAGAGIEAADAAKVEVSGNVAGGNQIADPNVAPNIIDEGTEHEYLTAGYGGDGVDMTATADVTVGGDVTGGNASGQGAVAGCGAYIELTLTANVSRDPETGESVAVKNTPGQLTVKGTITAGDSTGKNGEDGAVLFYAQPVDYETGEYLDNPVKLITDEQVKTICSNENLTYVRYSVTDNIPRMIFNSGKSYLDTDKRRAYQEEYNKKLALLVKEYGVDADEGTPLKDVIDSIPDEEVPELAKEAFNLCNEILQKMSLEVYVIPEVTAGGLVVNGDGDLILAMTDELTKYISDSYVEIVEPETEPESETKKPVISNPQNTDTPSTGDTSIPQVMTAVMVLSAAAVFGVVFSIMRKKRR